MFSASHDIKITIRLIYKNRSASAKKILYLIGRYHGLRFCLFSYLLAFMALGWNQSSLDVLFAICGIIGCWKGFYLREHDMDGGSLRLFPCPMQPQSSLSNLSNCWRINSLTLSIKPRNHQSSDLMCFWIGEAIRDCWLVTWFHPYASTPSVCFSVFLLFIVTHAYTTGRNLQVQQLPEGFQ